MFNNVMSAMYLRYVFMYILFVQEYENCIGSASSFKYYTTLVYCVNGQPGFGRPARLAVTRKLAPNKKHDKQRCLSESKKLNCSRRSK